METQRTGNEPSAARQVQAPLDRALDRHFEEERPLSYGAPSRPLLGVLPLSRLIPQDVHSLLDYTSGVAAGTGALMTDDPAAQIASIALAATVGGLSAITDYRLSGPKLVPVEAHEVGDYAWGIAAITAPFVLGYWKRAPQTALTHVVAGASLLLASLFTDYRSFKRRRSAR